MKLFFKLVFIFTLIACDKVELRPKPTPKVETITVLKDAYLLDGKGGIFNNLKWYEYSMENHIIWSFFDVYVIKTEDDIYKIQFISYFGDGAAEPGTYKIQVESKKGNRMKTVIVDATACGNPYSNPDYNNCLADPSRNIYSYLDLNTLQVKQILDSEATGRSDWDIAFKGTDIKLNAGTSGPKQVVGGLAKRFDFFFDSTTGKPISEALRNRELQNAAISGFKNVSLKINYNYYLRDGMDRVIHESEWFVTNANGNRESNTDLWWIVKEHSEKSFSKVNISEIVDILGADSFSTDFELSYLRQGEDDPTFGNVLEKMQLTFTNQNRTLSQCFNFKTNESFVCHRDRNDWDLKLVLVNILRNGNWTRDWRIFTNKGAAGPFTKDQIDEIASGR